VAGSARHRNKNKNISCYKDKSLSSIKTECPIMDYTVSFFFSSYTCNPGLVGVSDGPE
jgi:hypothetical protein